MEAYLDEKDDDTYEYDVREIIEKNGKQGNIRSFYYSNIATWEVEIDHGNYKFIGQISREGIPTYGSIIHKDQAVYFHNNKQLLNNNFKDTIIGLFQKKINENLQHAYEEEEEDEVEDAPQNRFEANKKTKRQRATEEYQNAFGGIQEQDHESDSEEEGNVIYKNTINEEPTPPTQQPQNQSTLNLWNSQSQQFGLRKNK